MLDIIDKKLLDAARELVRANVESEPLIQRAYLFPARDEIRLVEIDPTTSPSGDRIEAFYFAPDREGGIPYPSGIALILPNEFKQIPPPEGWGEWDEARQIWPEDGE